MKRAFVVGLLAFGLLGASVALASTQGEPPPKKVFKADKGPTKVDISTFPADVQRGYKTFASKCSRCHTLARPINTNMTTQGWKMYVKRMMNKPNSGISPGQGKTIYKFLKFYQGIKNAKSK